MKIDFVKNTKRNLIASVIYRLIQLLFPFFNRTLFLWILGSAYLGLNGLFTSILGVLMLSELGFGNAIINSMFKPVAEDNKDLLCAYLRFFRTLYRWVGTCIFIAGLCLLPFLRYLVHGNIPSDVNLYILFLIHLCNTSASYFFFAYRGSIFSAHHRKDVLDNIRSTISVIQYIVVFLILFFTKNYYLYIIVTVLFTMTTNVLFLTTSRKMFPDIEPRGELPEINRRKIFSDIKSIIMHKFGGIITGYADNIVISSLLGLVAVAAYGNYYYVLTSVGGFISAFSISMHGGFGNKIHTETKEENFSLFMKMTRLTLIVTIWSASMTAALYQPFITVWTKGNPTLVRHWLTPVLMVLFFYIQHARQVLLTFKSAAMIWKEDQWKPVVAGIANLIINIMLVLLLPDDYKLDGVIFSTILTLIFVQMPWESHALFTVFFNKSQSRKYWCMQGGFSLLALVLCSASATITYYIPIEGLYGLIVKGIAATIFSSLSILILFRHDCKALLQTLLKKK